MYIYFGIWFIYENSIKIQINILNNKIEIKKCLHIIKKVEIFHIYLFVFNLQLFLLALTLLSKSLYVK